MRDTGIGINKDEIKKLFLPHYRSSDWQSRSLNPLGKGLGLYVSKQICYAAGGNLEVSSELGVGSEFNFTMIVKPDNPFKKLYSSDKA